MKNGYLSEVIKGWYITTPSDEKPGDSTSWYASFWHFCAGYLADRYKNDYFLSPDQSLLIHAGNWTVPQQLLIRTSKKTNHNTPLPHNTSLWHWESPEPPAAEFANIDGLRMLSLATSIIYCTPAVFTKNPTDVKTALAMIRDSSEITRPLLQGWHTTIAGRLAGAFRSIGRLRIADDIISTLKAADYNVRETNPFDSDSQIFLNDTVRTPWLNRMKLLWHQMRMDIPNLFPQSPGIPLNQEAYMAKVEEIYTTDAYHSLSIERYKVTPALIERVRDGAWNIAGNEDDRLQRDAMAARGYWQASQIVRSSVRKVLNGQNPGQVADEDHGAWYRELFAPGVAAGILQPADLAGYRNSQVYISGSKYIPVESNAVRDVMPVFFDLLATEPHASVRAVLGHFMFVYVHPYMDGNGRIARFLMNVMLASGGFPWTVIPVQQRNQYMQALELASTQANIKPFAELLAWLVKETMKGHPVAGVE